MESTAAGIYHLRLLRDRLVSVKNKLVKICERFSGVISYRRNVLDIHDRGEKGVDRKDEQKLRVRGKTLCITHRFSVV